MSIIVSLRDDDSMKKIRTTRKCFEVPHYNLFIA